MSRALPGGGEASQHGGNAKQQQCLPKKQWYKPGQRNQLALLDSGLLHRPAIWAGFSPMDRSGIYQDSSGEVSDVKGSVRRLSPGNGGVLLPASPPPDVAALTHQHYQLIQDAYPQRGKFAYPGAKDAS